MLREPNRKDRLSADWARDLVREVRRQRVTAGVGLRETQTDNGKILSMVQHDRPPARAQAGWPFGSQYAFGIEISGATVKVFPGSIEAFGVQTTTETTLTITADGQYAGLALKMSDKTVTIELSNARPATNDTYYRTALYSFDFAGGVITGWHDHIHDLRMEAIF